jgi:hypothetical protein
MIAASKLAYKRWINWNKEYLGEVIKEGANDKILRGFTKPG